MNLYPAVLAVLISLVSCSYTDDHGNKFPRSSSAFESQVDQMVKPGDSLRQAGLTLKERGFFLHGDFGSGIDSFKNNNPPANRLRSESKVKATMLNYSNARYSQWVVTLGHEDGRVTSVDPIYTNGWALDL